MTLKSSSSRLLFVAATLLSQPALAGDGAGAPSRPEASAEESLPHATLELCVMEHERGRLFRNDLRLLESRAALARCAQMDCPVAIRADCVSWLSELEALVPSVLLVIEGESSGSLRVTVDGQPLAKRWDEPIELTPGVHRLRFELPPHAPIEREVVLAPGEKNRVVRVRFGELRRPEHRVAAAPPVLNTTRPIPAATYWLGAGALLWATTSAVLAGSAIVDESRANEQCAPRCPEDVRLSIERRLLFADIAGGIALGLAGLAVYDYLSRPTVTTRARPEPRLSVEASESGATVLFGGRF